MPYGYTQPRNWKATKARILSRDQRICYVCGGIGADEVDHVVPVSQGGSHEDDNLAAIHRDPCHRIKSDLERRAGWTKRKPRKTTTRPPEAHPGKRQPDPGE